MHIYFLNITDGITLLVYSKKLKNNYCKCHYTDGFTNGTGPSVYLKSWKIIIANVTAIVNALMELQMVFCQ
jgi:hypothetical protein